MQIFFYKCNNGVLGLTVSVCFFDLQLSSDANFVWRLAKATYFKSQIIGARDKEEQKKLVYVSKDLANEALQIDEKNSNAHKW